MIYFQLDEHFHEYPLVIYLFSSEIIFIEPNHLALLQSKPMLGSASGNILLAKFNMVEKVQTLLHEQREV